MKLTKENIEHIDHFLERQKIKYLDVRSELIDHLASEFEEQSEYGLIEDFLNSKKIFTKQFAKRYQKTLHWSYQKLLWIEFFKFFYKPKYMLVFALLIITGYVLFQNMVVKEFHMACFFILVILVLYPLIYNIRYSNAINKVQSFQSLFAVTALPSLFLYTFNLVSELLHDNYILGLIYFGTGILLSLSAAIIVEKNRSNALEKYHQLVG